MVPPTPTRSGDLRDEVLAVLRQFVSGPTSRSILDLARQRAGRDGVTLDRVELRALLEQLQRSVRFFVADPAQATQCLRALERLASPPRVGALATSVKREIRAEEDIGRARAEARDLASAWGFSIVGQTRLATAVSELARNIFQYAGTGVIEATYTASPPTIEVVAKDAGPGIWNVEQVLAGRYKSKLGMGLGLRGVKQLADRFAIATAAGGTTITFSLRAR